MNRHTNRGRPWHHLAVLAVSVAAMSAVAALTGTPAYDAILPIFVCTWAALVLQIGCGAYDRWI
jgi:hypothetical protein